MKKTKRGIEISHWKVENTDTFDSIAPAWTDEELDIGPIKEDFIDADQNNVDHAQVNRIEESK